jgi:hypothetical protein
MSQKIQFRRGTSGERVSTIFDQGEPAWDVTTKTLYIGDGATAGGISMSGQGGSSLNPNTIVYTTGFQNIIGGKNFEAATSFAQGLTVGDEASIFADFYVSNNSSAQLSMGESWLGQGYTIYLDWLNRGLSGSWNAESFSINNYPINPNTIVYKTGIQTISGQKTFAESITVDGILYALTTQFQQIYSPSFSNEIHLVDCVLKTSSTNRLDWKNRMLSGNWQVATASPPTGDYRSNGTKGYLAISGGYLYACTGTNLWGRTALTTF